MMWINLKRVLKTGFIQFWRNGVVSLSAVLVMVITLFVIGTILFTSALLTQSLDTIKDKVDINVYFINDATESDVQSVQKAIEGLPEVAFVEYVSSEDSLRAFIERHKNDQKTLEALEELDENPLGAVLNIKAKETSQYESVANYLDQNYPAGVEGSIVERVNYFQNKEAIEKLSEVISAGQKLGSVVTILFIIISIIITLNTIRLAMYISRDEIHVMKLVGANRSYITGPFVVTGAMYGVVAAILTLIIFWPTTFWLGDTTRQFFGTSIFEYYISSFGQMFLIIFGSGIIIGTVSSYLAIKRYLRTKKK